MLVIAILPILFECLLLDKKKVTVFGTGGRIAYELNDLRGSGLEIFDVRKIREVIER